MTHEIRQVATAAAIDTQTGAKIQVIVVLCEHGHAFIVTKKQKGYEWEKLPNIPECGE